MSVKVPPISTPTLNLVIQQYPSYRPSPSHRYGDGARSSPPARPARGEGNKRCTPSPRLRGDSWSEGPVILLFRGHRDDGRLPADHRLMRPVADLAQLFAHSPRRRFVDRKRLAGQHNAVILARRAFADQ